MERDRENCKMPINNEKLIFPDVHLNGTSADELLDQLKAANRALRESVEKLRLAAPNGRDYYTLAPGAFETAREQWRRRIAAVEGVAAELGVIASDVYRQKSERGR